MNNDHSASDGNRTLTAARVPMMTFYKWLIKADLYFTFCEAKATSDGLRRKSDVARTSQIVAQVILQKLNKVQLFHFPLRSDVVSRRTLVRFEFLDSFVLVRATEFWYGVRCQEIQCSSLLQHRVTSLKINQTSLLPATARHRSSHLLRQK